MTGELSIVINVNKMISLDFSIRIRVRGKFMMILVISNVHELIRTMTMVTIDGLTHYEI